MSIDLDPVVLYFKSHLPLGQKYTEDRIKGLVSEDKFFGGGKLSEEQLRYVVRELISSFDIVQNIGHTIRSKCDPWFIPSKKDINFYYWDRLKNYMLANETLPPNVISTLDRDTDEILDCCGNPKHLGSWAQRGMVIGHVQSGKTTNYSAVITKAADAGYKIIILLAGITNSLRSQTQQRLDEYFIGRKSVFQAAAEEPMEILKYCNEKRDPAYGTSREQDFNKLSATNAGVSLASLSEPMIFITKKNKSTLENLDIWIKDQHHGRRIDYPLLLIDDEADNASINTHQDPRRSTTINTLIREILANFSKSTYIGYTATPFANIFIEPDSQQEMEEEDLFPRNFIKALEPPTNYSGAERIFIETGDLFQRTVRPVDDYVNILPLGHKKEDARDLQILPESLLKAVRVFLLARAIRVIRGDGHKHCSMMINVSRFNDVQEKVEGLVYSYLQNLKSAIAVSALSEEANEDPHINDLKNTFDEEYAYINENFGEILEVLHSSASSVVVTTVNMRGGKLDYDKHKKTGLHVIAIGGLALSRGLTLDGLVVSYILRNVSASDTLMQLARWFGYRKGYEDLCKIYLPQSAINHYAQTHIAIEELCSEVYRMEQLNMTPYEFGLKVRQSETGIKITAANKMRTASDLILAQDYSGQHIEAHAIYNDSKVNDKHKEATRKFFSEIGPFSKPLTDQHGYYYWDSVNGISIFNLIKEFSFPDICVPFANISGTSTLILDYISDRLSADLKDWHVAIAGPRARSTLPVLDDLILGLELMARHRSSGDIIKGVFRATRTKNKVADPGDAAIGLSNDQKTAAINSGIKGDRKYCLLREKPLLIVHIFGATKEDCKDFNLGPHCFSLSVCFPTTEIRSKERKYKVNKVFRNSFMQPIEDEEDDDEEKLMENPTL